MLHAFHLEYNRSVAVISRENNTSATVWRGRAQVSTVFAVSIWINVQVDRQFYQT